MRGRFARRLTDFLGVKKAGIQKQNAPNSNKDFGHDLGNTPDIKQKKRTRIKRGS